MGGWENWDEVPDMFADTCAFLDTSFASDSLEPLNDDYWDGHDISMLDRKKFMEFIKIFGSNRLLFGSDSPWTDQGKSIKFLKDLLLDKKDFENIVGRNAMKLLDL